MTYLYSNQNKYSIDINFVHDINIEVVVMSIRYTSGRHGNVLLRPVEHIFSCCTMARKASNSANIMPSL